MVLVKYLFAALFVESVVAVEIIDEEERDCVECGAQQPQKSGVPQAEHTPVRPARPHNRLHSVPHFFPSFPTFPAWFSDFSDLERNFVPALPKAEKTSSLGHLDIHESASEITIHCAVPGVEEKNIRIVVEKPGRLAIKGHKARRTSKKEGSWTVQESSSGSFVRRLSIDSSIRASDIVANVENGELILHIPKHGKDDSNVVKIGKRE